MLTLGHITLKCHRLKLIVKTVGIKSHSSQFTKFIDKIPAHRSNRTLLCIVWIEFLCISVLRVASKPKMILHPHSPYSTDRSKAVVPVLVLLFVALLFILRGDLFYVLPCVILFLWFSVLLTMRLPRLGKRELKAPNSVNASKRKHKKIKLITIINKDDTHG